MILKNGLIIIQLFIFKTKILRIGRHHQEDNSIDREERLRNKNEWLDDEDIFSYLKLLKICHPKINGLEDPILVSHSKRLQKTVNFVRVMLAGYGSNSGDHWVCVRGNNGIIEIYDSLPRTDIDPVLLKNILNVIPDELKLKKIGEAVIKSVQRQKGQYCGYFALAFASSLCQGLNPENLIYDESEIREHYFKTIFHGKRYSPFPSKETRRDKNNILVTFKFF